MQATATTWPPIWAPSTPLDLLERFQLSDDELFRCFDHAASKGLVPLCTPWDETSLDKLNRWGMERVQGGVC